jgi:hypothetical protein
MNDAALKAALEREERAYWDLVQARASLGTMLAESVRKDRDLSEFVQHKRDLLLLTRSADIRRTELKVELLARQLKKAEEEQRRAIEAAERTAAALEEARRAYARAANVERRCCAARRWRASSGSGLKSRQWTRERSRRGQIRQSPGPGGGGCSKGEYD